MTGHSKLRAQTGMTVRGRAIVLSALMAVLAARAVAQAPVVERLDVLSSGIFEVDITGRAGSDEGFGGVRNTIGAARLVASTDSVPVRHCISFGFEYVIVGSAKGARIPLRMITRVPPPGLRNPNTGQVVREIETVLPRVVGERHVRVYTLEHEWELLPGQWVLEIWEGRRRLAIQSFTLHGQCENDCGRRDDHDQCTKQALSELTD